VSDVRTCLAVGALLSAWLAVGVADASGTPGKSSAKSHGQDRSSIVSRSLGSPTRGALEGGVALPTGRFVALRNGVTARWGLPVLVGLLERSARRVAKLHPESVLLVGDLSTRKGGRLGGHRSHQSGRDADVGFYYTDARERPVLARRFWRVDDAGRVVGERTVKFDDARNWALVESWLIDPEARIQHVFVADPLRRRLLSHARSVGVYPPVLHRASLALKQPSRGLAHDDHFHIRIACPRDQREGCVPEPQSKEVANLQGREAPSAGLQQKPQDST
jgi:penicillin-insensitive murein endopeptidase